MQTGERVKAHDFPQVSAHSVSSDSHPCARAYATIRRTSAPGSLRSPVNYKSMAHHANRARKSTICYTRIMEKIRPPFVRWKQRCWCFDAAQRDLTAAEFLLDERFPLDDRFEVAARILCPRPAAGHTLH